MFAILMHQSVVEMAATHCLFQVETHVRPFVADPSISFFIKAFFLLQHFRKFFPSCQYSQKMPFNIFVKLQREKSAIEIRERTTKQKFKATDIGKDV